MKIQIHMARCAGGVLLFCAAFMVASAVEVSAATEISPEVAVQIHGAATNCCKATGNCRCCTSVDTDDDGVFDEVHACSLISRQVCIYKSGGGTCAMTGTIDCGEKRSYSVMNGCTGGSDVGNVVGNCSEAKEAAGTACNPAENCNGCVHSVL